MENLFGSFNNSKKSPAAIKYFDGGDVFPTIDNRSRFHVPIPLSPLFNPYDSSESPNSPNPLFNRSISAVPFDLSGGGESRSGSGGGGFGSPLSSIENIVTQRARSPMTVFKTPVKVEEDVIVMDGFLVKPKSGGARPRATAAAAPPSDSGGENKKEACWYWENAGNCRSGSKCQYAHGQEERQPSLTPRNYKSQVCRAFSSGSCLYGSRCRFLHHREPEKELEQEQGQANYAAPSPSARARVDFPSRPAPATPVVIKPPPIGEKTRTSAATSSSSAAAAAQGSGNAGWSPLNDGIKILLPGKATTQENVDAYIHSVLYCPTPGKKRLPVFDEICPN